MNLYVALAYALIFFGHAVADDIDDPFLVSSGAKLQAFDSPKIITLFSQPQSIQSIIPDRSSDISMEEKCKLISADKQQPSPSLSPFMFILPSSEAPTRSFPFPPSKAVVTATVTSAFQIENFIQSLAILLGSGKISTSASLSLPTADCKKSPKATTSVVHITSTVIKTTQGCFFPTSTIPLASKNVCPILSDSSLSISLSSVGSSSHSVELFSTLAKSAYLSSVRSSSTAFSLNPTQSSFTAATHIYPSSLPSSPTTPR
ncbi:hypothetical protein MDAP_001133 [Mitosporidium daphniae]